MPSVPLDRHREGQDRVERTLIPLFVAMFVGVVVPLLTISHPPVYLADRIVEVETPLVRLGQYASAFFATIVTIFAFIAGGKYRPKLDNVGTLFLLVLFSILITSILRELPLSVAYAALAIILFASASVFWALNDDARLKIFKHVQTLCIICIMAAFALYGAPKHRYVGGIHPNNLAQLGVAAAFLGILLGDKRFAAGLVVGLALAVAVDSRYAMICVVLAAGTGIFIRTEKNRSIIVILAIGAMIVLPLAASQFTDLISSALKLDDRTRGFSSGVSGRSELWALFAPQISTHPLSGFGFRNRSGYFGTHNGYMDTLLQLGVILGPLVIASYFMRLFTMAGASDASATPARKHERLTLTSLLLALMFAAAFQPQLINFGDIFGLITVLILSRPNSLNLEPKAPRRRTMARTIPAHLSARET